LIGCGWPLEVAFRGATSVPGVYRFEVTADGAPSTCQIALPFGCDTRPTCDAIDPGWRLTLSGCALGPDRETIDGLTFPVTGPNTLDIIVRRDGVEVGTAHAEPVYTTSRPNGPDCEPVCRSAPSLSITLR